MFEKILGIPKTYRHINRYTEIIGVIIKYGFGDFIHKINILKHIKLGSEKLPSNIDETKSKLSKWVRVRLILEELGPSFIKLGQIMSTRPDLLPPELILELEKLQHEVQPFSAKIARDILERELGKSIQGIFKLFMDKPVASASIAQIHKATLLTGEEVAVKIQRPKIRDIIKVDIEIMFHLASLIERYTDASDILDPTGIVKEFSGNIIKELNFKLESSNIQRFIANFYNDDRVYIPRIFLEYCTEKVLIMEFVHAIPLTQKRQFKDLGIDPKEIAHVGAQISLKQIFDFGLFHADPHPGNLFVKDQNTIVLLDFGMVGFLSKIHREYIGDLIVGTALQDTGRIARTALRMTNQQYVKNFQQLEAEIDLLVMQYAYIPIKDIQIGRLLQQMMEILMSYQLRLPSNYYLLIKAMITIEGLVLDLDPDFKIMEYVIPFAKKIVRARLNPKRLAKEAYLASVDTVTLVRDLPSEIQDILALLKEGKLRMEFEHQNLEPMLEVHDQISNRIVFAIVLGSLIIGSSVVVHSGIPPKWNEIPVIGVIGYIVAGIMGFWLLISIIKHKKM